MDETTSLLASQTVSINDTDKKHDGRIRLSLFQQLAYGIYNTGQFACVIPFMLITLPNRVQYFVSNEDKGKALGLILMAGNIALAIAGPLIGHFSDVTSCGFFPKRKTYLVVGTIFTCLSIIAVTYAPFYYMVVIFFTGLCLSVSLSGPSFMALFSDIAYPDQINKTTSIATTLQEVGGIIGSIAGLSLAFISISELAIILCAFQILCLIITCTSIPESTNKPSIPPSSIFSAFSETFKHKDRVFLLLCTFACGCGTTIFELFLQYYTKDVLIDYNFFNIFKFAQAETATSFLSILYTIGAVFGAFLGNLSNRVGRRTSVFIACITMGIGTVLLLLVRKYMFAVLTCLLYGSGYGGFFAVVWAYWTAVVKDNNGAAKDMGVWQMAFLSPKIFVPFLGGYLLDTFQVYGEHIHVEFLGYIVVFGLSSVFFLIAACIVWLIKKT